MKKMVLPAASWSNTAVEFLNSIGFKKLFGYAVFLVLLPIAAHAQEVSGGSSPVSMIQNVCTFILGPFGKTVVVLAIIAIGLMFMFGRASLGVIAGIIGGVVIMYGAAYLGSTLLGS